MKITQEKNILEILGELMVMNRRKGASPEYLKFLSKIFASAYDDMDFGRAIEACLELNISGSPSIEQVEVSLAKMEGGIRPLLVDKGIVEPSPMV